MKVDSLVSCTIVLLKLLIRQFELGNINFDTFDYHTCLKIKLLEDNIDKICSQEIKSAAMEVLDSYRKINKSFKSLS